MRTRGFTLIELLVVMGIIVLLAGILLPAVMRVMRHADRAAVVAQMQSIAVGIQVYQSDYEGQLPGPVPDLHIGTGVSSDIGGLTYPDQISGTENLFLGLSGGLRYTGSAVEWIPGTDGVYKLRPVSATRKTGPYVKADKGVSGGKLIGYNDSDIPEYVDKFGTPLLYFRRNPKTAILIGQGDASVSSQYRWSISGSVINRPQGMKIEDGAAYTRVTPIAHGLRNLGSPAGTSSTNNPVGAKDFYDFLDGLTNFEYLLISAGADGVFGTKDDILNVDR